MEQKFIHNFCESRLNNNQPPELYNSYTSLVITFFPLILGFPKNNIFYNVACMLAFNGIASFYYHYKLNWIGKQADEISMILATYFGIWGLLKMYYIQNKNLLNWYNGWNTMYMINFLVFNTISKYDYLFPILFSSYIGTTLYLIHKVSNKYKYPYKKYIIISFIGAKCWIISEVYCTEYTKFGHVIWHCLFPIGFYKLVLEFDSRFRELKHVSSF
tara:strand:+ start:440 stop:1087 length:648 start_codon:yes stop_codon:yes gene_type:complete